MKSSTVIVLAILGGLILVCVCAALASFSLLLPARNVVARNLELGHTPAEVASVARNIADYEVPEDYHGEFAMHLFDLSMVIYNRDDQHAYILLMQAPKGDDLKTRFNEERVQRTLRQGGYGPYMSNLRTVDRVTATIRGQQVQLVVGEGVNHDGTPYRQVTGAFDGKDGPALLVITQPVITWNQAEVDAFIESIR